MTPKASTKKTRQTSGAQEKKAVHSRPTNFNIFFENHPIPMWIYDLKSLAFLEVNDAAVDKYGYSRAEFMKMTIKDIRPEEDVGRLMADVQQARPALQYSGEWRHRARDGRVMDVEITSHTLKYKGREAVLVMAQDITERKRAEEALHDSEARLAGVINSAMDAVISVDGDQKIILFNAAAEKMFRCSAREALGESLGRFIPERFRTIHESHIRKFANTGLTSRSMGGLKPLSALRSDGEEFPIEASISQTTVKGQKILTVILRDITDRKRAEEELRQSFERERRAHEDAEHEREHLAFLAKASALISESFDYRERLKQVAQIAVPQIADWCAVDVLEADGSLHRVAVVHSDPAKVEWAYELSRRYPQDPNAEHGVYRVLRAGQPEFYAEISDAMLVHAARSEEHLALLRGLGFKSAMVVPFQARGRNFGAITLVMAESGRRFTNNDLQLIEDLAHRAALLIENARLYQEAQSLNMELEQRVAQRTAQLEAANKELESFSYSVSHDLRAPLRAIDGFSLALLEDYTAQLPPQGQDYLRRVRASAQRMAELIDDLLNLSRVTRAPFASQPLNLSELAESVFAELQRTQPERRITISVAPNLMVNGDPHLLRIMLENLLGNAWKFTSKQENARIEVGVLDQGASRIFYVRDNGAGFDMKYAGKLFGAFQRLHSLSEFPGTGIGLATVQRIIHRHGGNVWAEGRLNEGATFYFTL